MVSLPWLLSGGHTSCRACLCWRPHNRQQRVISSTSTPRCCRVRGHKAEPHVQPNQELHPVRATGKFPHCYLQKTKFVIVNSSSAAKDELGILRLCLKLSPNMFHLIESPSFVRYGITQVSMMITLTLRHTRPEVRHLQQTTKNPKRKRPSNGAGRKDESRKQLTKAVGTAVTSADATKNDGKGSKSRKHKGRHPWRSLWETNRRRPRPRGSIRRKRKWRWKLQAAPGTVAKVASQKRDGTQEAGASNKSWRTKRKIQEENDQATGRGWSQGPEGWWVVGTHGGPKTVGTSTKPTGNSSRRSGQTSRRAVRLGISHLVSPRYPGEGSTPSRLARFKSSTTRTKAKPWWKSWMLGNAVRPPSIPTPSETAGHNLFRDEFTTD